MPPSFYTETVPDSLWVAFDDILDADAKSVFEKLPTYTVSRLESLPRELMAEIDHWQLRDRQAIAERQDQSRLNDLTRMVADLLFPSAVKPQLSQEHWEAVLWIARIGLEWIDTWPQWSTDGKKLVQCAELSFRDRFTANIYDPLPTAEATFSQRIIGDQLHCEIDALIKQRVAEKVAAEYRDTVAASLGSLIFQRHAAIQPARSGNDRWSFFIGRLLCPPLIQLARDKALETFPIVFLGEQVEQRDFAQAAIRQFFDFSHLQESARSQPPSAPEQRGDPEPDQVADEKGQIAAKVDKNLPRQEGSGHTAGVDKVEQAIQIFKDQASQATVPQLRTAGLILTEEVVRYRAELAAQESELTSKRDLRVANEIAVAQETDAASGVSGLCLQLKALGASDTQSLQSNEKTINRILGDLANKRFPTAMDLQDAVHSIQEIVRRGGFRLIAAEPIKVKEGGKLRLKIRKGAVVTLAAESPHGRYKTGRVGVTTGGDWAKSVRRVSFVPLAVTIDPEAS